MDKENKNEIEKKSQSKKKKLVLIIVTLLLVITGTTLAVWGYNYVTNTNILSSAEVKIEFLESSNEIIAVTNAIPLSDEEGKKQEDKFTFQITTKASNKAIKYNLNIEKVTGPEGYTDLKDSEVKIYLTDYEDNPLVGPILISELDNYNLYSKVNTHENNNEIKDKYKLRVWIAESAKDNYDWSKQNNLAYNFKIGVSSEEYVPVPTAADTIISKVGTDGIVEETHEATIQLEANTDYRYTGAYPNNYVSFNNELWRIIGVFPTDDGTGNTENRIKIIRNESIGKYSWDNKASGTGSSTSNSGSNDWSDSALQIILNSGAYYNRTTGNCPSGQNGATKACDFSTTGLTEEAKRMISDAKWYLGGTSSYSSASNGLASHFYSYERGTDVYSGRPTSFIGEVGLMYPSDYGYATSGGSTTSREECLAKELYNWNSSDYTDCKNNDWLLYSSAQWTMAPRSRYSSFVFSVESTGYVDGNIFAGAACAVRPVLALASTVGITGGTGTESDPYILGI